MAEVVPVQSGNPQAYQECASIVGKALQRDLIFKRLGVSEEKSQGIFQLMAQAVLAEKGCAELVYLAQGRGAAIWTLHTGETKGIMQLLHYLWNGGFETFWQFPFRLWKVHAGIGACMDEHKAKFFEEHGRFYHLEFVAVLPGEQGQGLGSQLLLPVLAKADMEHRWCYLESSSEASKRMYERLGFQSKREWRYQTHMAPFYSMERPPQSTQNLA